MNDKNIPPFDITQEMLHLVSEISEQVGAINERLGDNAPAPMLRKENQIKTIHSSLAIEHNSLSLSQVTDIINGKHILGAPNEIKEVKNAVQAYELMQKLDAHSEKDLLKAHGLMMSELVDKAGRYRTDGVGVFDGGRCIHVAPPADRVPKLMADLFEWLRTTDVHPLIASCVFHYEFEFIHPFLDGNGRMGRYWQTMILARWKGVFAWIPVETIVKDHQQEYYDAIARSDSQGKSTDFIVFMLHCLNEAINKETTSEVPNKVPDKVPNKLKKAYSDLPEVVWNVYSLLQNDNRSTAKDIGQQLSISDRMVRKYMSLLKEKHLIERIGSNKNGYWKVNIETI